MNHGKNDDHGVFHSSPNSRLLDLIPDIVFSLDSSHRFVYVNNSITALGYCPDGVVGTAFEGIVHPEDHEEVSDYLKRGVSSRTQNRRRTIRKASGLRLRLIPCREKRELPGESEGTYAPFSYAEVFVGPGYTTNDGNRGAVGIIRNLAVQRKMEVEKAQLEEQLARSQKLEAVGRLAGGIAHDFNNLLGAISGYAELINQQVDQEKAQNRIRKYSKNILTAAEHAGDLIGKLLLFANREKNPMRRMDFHDALDSVFSDSGIRQNTLVNIRREYHAESSSILGDEGRLKNAFFNLLVNAYEAMPDGGEIVVRTEIVVFDENPDLNGVYRMEPGVYACISVTDTGIGMDRETCRKVFEPFFTTKDSQRGTGLGLAGVYGVVQAHNGYVHLYSEPGNGTTVRVYLPSLYTPEDEKRLLPKKTELVRGTGKLMVVDDEPLVLSACTDILRLLGYETVGFLDSEKAVGYFEQNADTVDLVLVDMIMPRMSGREFYRRIRTLNPTIKCILTTGHLYTSRVGETLNEGFVALIEKPFPASKLSQIVSQAINGRSFSGSRQT